MFGIYFSYRDQKKEYLIEKFNSEQEAMSVKEKYIVDIGETVTVKEIEEA